jgi:hypothetical protein
MQKITNLLLAVGIKCGAHVGIRVLFVPRDHLVSEYIKKWQGLFNVQFYNYDLGVMLPENSPQKCLNLERRVYQAPEKKILKTQF